MGSVGCSSPIRKKRIKQVHSDNESGRAWEREREKPNVDELFHTLWNEVIVFVRIPEWLKSMPTMFLSATQKKENSN